MRLRRPVHLAVVAVASLLLAGALHGQSNAPPERFIAAAVNPNRGTSGMVEIVVDRWSTDAERDQLIQVALDQGPEKLLSVLQKLPRVGYFRAPDSVGWDLHYARRAPQAEGGERIVLMTDRRIGFWEQANQAPTVEYPFTVIEMHLNADGKGDGKMSLATRLLIDRDERQITLENWDLQPVLLTQVQREER